MKKLILFIILPFLAAFRCDGQNLLLEAEDFQFRGGWNLAKERGSSGTGILMVTTGSGPAIDALTVIKASKTTQFNVWVRSKDYALQAPGTRLSCVIVNLQQLSEQGKHGHDGFYWERVGKATLSEGQNVVRLHDTKANYARVDAILFTEDSSFDPNGQQDAALSRFRIKPLAVSTETVDVPAKFHPDTIGHFKEAAQIGNNNIRLKLLQSAAADRIFTKIETNKKGKWVGLDNRFEDCRISLISSANTSVSYGSYLPSWSSTRANKYVLVNGVKYDIAEKDDRLNPYRAGTIVTAMPRKIKSVSKDSVEMIYSLSNEDSLTVTWKIVSDSYYINMEVSYRVKNDGYYSVAVDAFQGVDSAFVTNVQLPPLYQYQRIPPAPTLVPLAMSPQPVSIVEIKDAAGHPFSFFIAGDPEQYSRSWGAYDFGLGLKGIDNRVQPVAFSPVLGLKESFKKKGARIQRSFKLGLLPIGWHNTLEYVSDSIFLVRDYRRQTTSLTRAVFNMIDLMKNDTASGWSEKRKGFLDIESDPSRLTEVAQSAPLSVLSASVLTNDEDLYIKRALPIIEYTLSRKGYRWGIPTRKSNDEFNPFVSQFNTAYFEGLNFLLDDLNPWIRELAMPGGLPRYSKGYGVNEGWTGDLAAYKLTKDTSWLLKAKAGADKFIYGEILGRKDKLQDPIVFYNVFSYPAWFDLLDIYEITSDNKYLTAAMYGAYFTIAGIRTYPIVKSGKQVIHPRGSYSGNNTIFWKEGLRFKLGYPRRPGDVEEKSVFAPDVSPVGLGFEQPTTLFTGNDNIQNVYMSSWAPSLLRLNNAGTGSFFETYARNAVIGRFANYPGYYASGYTDLVLDPVYPYKGPDVTSIYYHHIPAHLSFSVDFLVLEAIQRSKGKISFPYSKQQGFVWFNNRVYGRGAGRIEEEKVSLFFKKDLVNIANQSFNYLTAISDNKLYVILLNENAVEDTAKVIIGNFNGYVSDGIVSKPVKAKGIEMVSFPLLKPFRYPDFGLKPVKDGMRIIELGKTMGKLYIYRIRSPFGWDSVYGFVSNDLGRAIPNVRAVLSRNISDDAGSRTSFPYEWSFLKISPNEDVNLIFSVNDGNKQIKQVKIQI